MNRARTVRNSRSTSNACLPSQACSRAGACAHVGCKCQAAPETLLGGGYLGFIAIGGKNRLREHIIKRCDLGMVCRFNGFFDAFQNSIPFDDRHDAECFILHPVNPRECRPYSAFQRGRHCITSDKQGEGAFAVAITRWQDKKR
jgi:hypothetical protein